MRRLTQLLNLIQTIAKCGKCYDGLGTYLCQTHAQHVSTFIHNYRNDNE